MIKVILEEAGNKLLFLQAMEESGTADVKSVATNIQPKNLDISATVTAVYQIY